MQWAKRWSKFFAVDESGESANVPGTDNQSAIFMASLEPFARSRENSTRLILVPEQHKRMAVGVNDCQRARSNKDVEQVTGDSQVGTNIVRSQVALQCTILIHQRIYGIPCMT